MVYLYITYYSADEIEDSYIGSINKKIYNSDSQAK